MGLGAKRSLIDQIWGSLLILGVAVTSNPVFAQGVGAGQKIMGGGAAKINGTQGGIISTVFTCINYLAGIAVAGVLIFGLISLWQRRKASDAAAEAEQAEALKLAEAGEDAGKAGEASSETVAASEGEAKCEDKPAEEQADTKAEEK